MTTLRNGVDEANPDSVSIKGQRGSIVFSRTSDGGMLVEQEIREIDGKRDHLVTRCDISPVDARRVFQLLGEPTDRNSTGG